MRTAIAVAAGALVLYVIEKHANRFFFSLVHTMDWMDDAQIWGQLATFMIPGIVVGAIAPKHSTWNAILAAFIGCVCVALDMVLRRPDYRVFNPHFIVFTLLSCTCGAITSCYGARLSSHLQKLFPRLLHFFTAE